jgi:hypothetical protein
MCSFIFQNIWYVELIALKSSHPENHWPFKKSSVLLAIVIALKIMCKEEFNLVGLP